MGKDVPADRLDDLFSGTAPTPLERAPLSPAAPYMPAEERIERIAHNFIVENCRACKGRGRFISYAGRDCGPCFKCKGRGQLEFKSTAEERAKAKTVREERKARVIAEAHETYKTANPDAYAWMLSNAATFPFAAAMLDAITRWGQLTERQQIAVDKCLAARARKASERDARIAAAPDVNTAKLEAAFARVQKTTNAETANDVGTVWKLPVLRLDTFHITPARKFPGTLYVKEGETYCGKIVSGKFHRARECTDDQQTRIAAACADPDAAARQYGLRYGICSCCGRALTNKLSRELGIGPICRSRWFAI